MWPVLARQAARVSFKQVDPQLFPQTAHAKTAPEKDHMHFIW